MKLQKIAGLLALVLLLASFCSLVGCEKEEEKIAVEKLVIEGYEVTDEVTDYVRLNITFTNADGKADSGVMILRLRPDYAPITVANFQKLVSEGFYDGLTFHRVAKSFVIQGGDPEGNGSGGSDEEIKGEFSANGVENPMMHTRGTISMARNSASMDSASSQFFIVTQTSSTNSQSLDGNYAAFGRVVFGYDTLDALASVEVDEPGSSMAKPVHPITIVSAVFVKKTA